MDIDDLLQTAAAAPLGPLSLTVAPDGQDAWWLNATLHNETVGIHAVRDPELNTLRLERQVPSDVSYERWRGAIEARPWVTDAAPMASGGVHVRYWLHAGELSLNHLLGAVADIARLAPLSDASSVSTATKPATPVRPTSWQTLPTPPTPPTPPVPPTPVGIAPAPPVYAAPVVTPEPAQPSIAAAMNSRICQECGEATNPEHSFCTNCGARLN